MDWFLCNQCLRPYSNDAAFVVTKCGHIFCGACASSASTCRECGQALNTLRIHREMTTGKEFFTQPANQLQQLLASLQRATKVESFRQEQTKLALKKLYRKNQELQSALQRQQQQQQQQQHGNPMQPAHARQHPHRTTNTQDPVGSRQTPTRAHGMPRFSGGQQHQAESAPQRATSPYDRGSSPATPLSARRVAAHHPPASRLASAAVRLSIRKSPADVMARPSPTRYGAGGGANGAHHAQPMYRPRGDFRSTGGVSPTFASMGVAPDGTPLTKRSHTTPLLSRFTTPAFQH